MLNDDDPRPGYLYTGLGAKLVKHLMAANEKGT